MNAAEEKRALKRHAKQDVLLQRLRALGCTANTNPGGGFRVVGPGVNAAVLTFTDLEKIVRQLERQQ